MTFESLLGITPYPGFSAVLLAVVAMAVLYLARGSAHHVLLTVCQALHDILNLAVQAITATEKKLVQRNHEVLLAAGREAKERVVEREFVRIGDSVHRDLSGYPGLQRALSDAITHIEEDHQKRRRCHPSRRRGSRPSRSSRSSIARSCPSVRCSATFTPRSSKRSRQRSRNIATRARSGIRCCNE